MKRGKAKFVPGTELGEPIHKSLNDEQEFKGLYDAIANFDGSNVTESGVNALDESGQWKKPSIPVAPANAYYVKLKNGPWRDRLEFTDQNGEKKELYLAADFNPGENAEVTAEVMSVPRRGGIPGIQVGDEIGFCYLAIYNEEVTGADPEGVFTEDEPTHPLIQTWSNKKDEILEREYLLNDRYAGRRYHAGIVVDEMKGTFGEFESWLEKVGKFREGAGKIDKNRLDWDGETYWKVETQFVYCVKRGEVVESVPGYVFCTVPEPVPAHTEFESGLIAVNTSTELPKRAWVMAVLPAPASGIKKADALYIRVDVAERYKFWGRDCLVVEDQYVMAGGIAWFPLRAAGAGMPDEPPFIPADQEDQVSKLRKRIAARSAAREVWDDSDLDNRKKSRRKK